MTSDQCETAAGSVTDRRWPIRKRVVSDYLENTPDDEMLRDAMQHLAGSPPCGMYLVQMQTMIRLIGGLSQESSSERVGHGYVPGAVLARTRDNHASH